MTVHNEAQSLQETLELVVEECGNRMSDGVYGFLAAIKSSDDRKLIERQLVEYWRCRYQPDAIATNKSLCEWYLKQGRFRGNRPSKSKSAHIDAIAVDYYLRHFGKVLDMHQQMERRAKRYSSQRR